MENKRLQKQNSILQVELNEKNRIIEELKKEIDETIVEDTKNKLCYIRYIEQEVEKKTADVNTYLKDIDEAEVFGGSGEGGEGSGWTNQRKQENRERIVGRKRTE